MSGKDKREKEEAGLQKIRMIALDLDGTTLDDESRLPVRTKRILERAAASGIYVLAASGRAYTSLPQEILDVRGLSYAITSNGAATYDIRNKKRCFGWTIEEEKAKRLLELIKEEPGTAVEVFVDGQPYAPAAYLEDPEQYGVPSRAVAYLRRTRLPFENAEEFILSHCGELDSVDIITQSPLEKAQWIEKLQKTGGLYVTSSVSYRLEISNEKGGKGAALREAAERLGVKPEEIIAFGNAENDMDMIRFAGLGVAVANSPETVRQCADRIAPPNTEEGVAQVLEEILFSS